MADVEDPSGWPFNAEGGLEMWEGCPHWSGGPWGAGDAVRADRLLRGWHALLGPEGHGLTLVVPGSAGEEGWLARGYTRVDQAPAGEDVVQRGERLAGKYAELYRVARGAWGERDEAAYEEALAFWRRVLAEDDEWDAGRS